MAPAKIRLLPAGFCILGIICAVFAVVARAQAQNPRRVVTVNISTAPAHIEAADDCPDTESCVLTGVRTSVVTAVLAAFPGVPTNDIAHAALAGTHLAPPETVHRETVDVRTREGVLVTVLSRCVDQGSDVRASQSRTVPDTGPATAFAVVPGRPGCSVAVILQVPAGVAVPWPAATALAHRPQLQLPG